MTVIGAKDSSQFSKVAMTTHPVGFANLVMDLDGNVTFTTT